MHDGCIVTYLMGTVVQWTVDGDVWSGLLTSSRQWKRRSVRW